MLTLIAIAFLLGTVYLIALLISERFAEGTAMPFSCLICGFGGDETLTGEHRHWFAWKGKTTVRCRKCGAYFKEHPNGMLVEDRD